MIRQWFHALIRWFDTGVGHNEQHTPQDEKIDLLRAIPFVAMHAACLCVFLVGWSWFAVGVAVLLYLVRMFAITGFYHRYFSHKTFKTSRPAQFVFACIANSAAQRGPLWWAAHHRHHHLHSDEEVDVHSPRHHGFWWAHMGWFLTRANFRTKNKFIKDLLKYPELKLLDRYDIAIPTLLWVGLLILGKVLERTAPGLGTTGWQLVVWGGAISTIFTFHATCCINSLAHKMGRRRFETTDDSKNSFILAMLTLGEGWHNNHHHYAASCRQGFYWWEIDITYYGLKVLSWLGIIRDIRPVPKRIISENTPDPQISA